MADDTTSSPSHENPRAREDVPMDRRVALIKNFQQLNPPMYNGREGPEEAEQFIDQLEKIFELLNCHPIEKVIMAEYALQREANKWWKATRQSAGDHYEGTPWDVFQAAFLDKYFPLTVREDRAREFDYLMQDPMTVDQYEGRFAELSRYVPPMDPVKRAKKFENGLSPRIRAQVAPLMLKSYEEIYRRAQIVEKTLRESDVYASSSSMVVPAVGKKRFPGDRPRNMNPGKRANMMMPPRMGISGSGRFGIRGRGRSPPGPPKCMRCGRNHWGVNCGGGNVICFQCGQPGHVRRNCPQATVNTAMSAPRPNVPRPGMGPRSPMIAAVTQGS